MSSTTISRARRMARTALVTESSARCRRTSTPSSSRLNHATFKPASRRSGRSPPRRMFFQCRSVNRQTTHVFSLLSVEASSDGSGPLPRLLAGELGIANRIDWTLLDAEFDASRQLFADVEAARPLLVVPIEAIPVRPVARSAWRALRAGSFATPHVLLAVDDPIWAPSPPGEISSARLPHRHHQSLHK